MPEIQRLLAQLVFHQRPPDPHAVIAASRWQRRHQAAARRAHYRARRT
jgi:hypothetical protein